MSSGNVRNILVAGGSGFIGSHTIVCLIEAGYNVTVLDNLVNSSEESLKRVRAITGCDESRIRFFNVDLCNYSAVEAVFEGSPRFDACIHFAGLKVYC
jgi:UDP-glucose 4-epimerase